MESNNRNEMSGGLFLETNLDRINMPIPLKDSLRAYRGSRAEIDKNRSGIPIMRIDGNEIYKIENPLEVVADQVDQISYEQKVDLVVLFGLGLGYHAELLERRCQCNVVVYDPCLDALSMTLCHRALPLEKTTIVNNLGHLLGEVQPRLQFTDRKLIVAAIPEYTRLFSSEFSLFKEIVEHALDNSWTMERTIVASMKSWVNNTALNLPRLAACKPVDVLRGAFAGKPGILVSTGPSLDRNIEILKSAKDNALIVAVNTSAKPLARAGVMPDIVTIVENLDLRAHFEGVDWLNKVFLAPSINCFPGLLDLPVKQILPIADLSVPCGAWLNKAFGWRRFLAGGSVACTGFAVLHELGCDPIILIGQDLAFTDGESYANGAAFGKQRLKLEEETNTLVVLERSKAREDLMIGAGRDPLTKHKALKVEAYGGNGTVFTNKMFMIFKVWFEAAARTWAGDRNLVNATEGGARIVGFEEMPLLDAVAKWCRDPLDKDRLIQEALSRVPEPDMSVLQNIITEELQIIEEVKDLSIKTGQSAQAALKKIEQGDIQMAREELFRLSALESEMRSFSRRSPLLDAFAGADINHLRVERVKDKDDDEARQTANSLRRSLSIFEIIAKNADELLMTFGSVVEKLG